MSAEDRLSKVDALLATPAPDDVNDPPEVVEAPPPVGPVRPRLAPNPLQGMQGTPGPPLLTRAQKAAFLAEQADLVNAHAARHTL